MNHRRHVERVVFFASCVLLSTGTMMGCGGPQDAAVESPVTLTHAPPSEIPNEVPNAKQADDEFNTVRLRDLVAELRPVYFDFDSFSIRSDSREGLNKIGEFMSGTADAGLVIEGHCDDRGSVEYNIALGEQRAKATRDYLLRLGVSPTQLRTVSFGNQRPAVKGNTESAWARNRRAEFVPKK